MSKYFYGHYFKLQSASNTIAFIPSYAKVGKAYTASLQVITKDESMVIDFPYEEYLRGDGFEVKIGNSVFNKDGIELDIDREDVRIKGNIRFGELAPLEGSIMGPFNYVPFMECKHVVCSIKHKVSGKIELNGKELVFEDGSYGYIEGDRGRSFPSRYIWTHSLFDEGSVMLSVADIPFGLFHFTGIIGFIKYKDILFRIGTYKFAKVVELTGNSVTVKQGKYILIVKLLEKNAYPLKAPTKGKMERIIKESLYSKVRYVLSIKGEEIINQVSESASMEFEL